MIRLRPFAQSFSENTFLGVRNVCGDEPYRDTISLSHLCACEMVGAWSRVPDHSRARSAVFEDQVQSFGSYDNSSERVPRLSERSVKAREMFFVLRCPGASPLAASSNVGGRVAACSRTVKERACANWAWNSLIV
jgi:hypothetical protein